MDLREIPTHAFVRHPWEVARLRFFPELLLSRIFGTGSACGPGPRRVLDVGAGDGYFARGLLATLPAGSTVTCWDANYTASDLMRLRREAAAGLEFCQERAQGAFDVLVLLDVLEHVENDVAFLGELARNALYPGGSALISVPAWNELYTRHDQVLGHHRRYRPAALRKVVAAADLRLEAAGGLFHSLLVPRALAKAGERLRGVRATPSPEGPAAHADTGLGTWRAGRAVTALVGGALWADNQLSRFGARLGLGLPGLSTWAVARKPAP